MANLSTWDTSGDTIQEGVLQVADNSSHICVPSLMLNQGLLRSWHSTSWTSPAVHGGANWAIPLDMRRDSPVGRELLNSLHLQAQAFFEFI